MPEYLKTRQTRKRVRRGAALLDRVMPTWFKKINLDQLNLADCAACVCGQLALHSRSQVVRDEMKDIRGRIDKMCGYGAFASYLNTKANGRAATALFPFNIEHGFTANHLDGDFEDLDAAWEREIHRRLTAVTS